MARSTRLLLLCLVGLLLQIPAHAASRVALVVGNAAYAEKPLRNPVNDAELMQRTLQGLGFEVALVRNADRRALLAGLRDFEAKARNADVALFYFAGHGTQVGGNNYLMPLGAQVRAESDVLDEAVDASSVLRRIEDAKAKVGLVILDACRDNPYTGATRSSSRGLGRMAVPTGSIVAYATAPGSTAEDGSGKNGIYTEQLAKHLSQPGLDLREVFDRTATEVERITGGKQKPREDVGLRGRFVLKDAGTQLASVGVVPTGRPATEQADPEQEAWQAAKAANSAAAYDAYLAEYPRGKFASAARIARAAVASAPSPGLQQTQPATSTATASTATQPGSTFKDCADCPDMVVVPAGSFMMGSNDGDADEKPVHRVTLRSFALGKFEVTQGQWKALMGSNPSSFKDCGDNCPVENVSWIEAQQFIQKLSQKTSQRYRLPSEAEWEYAARAGTTTRYWWGETSSHDYANYGSDQCCSGVTLGRDQWVNTAPVGKFAANAFGVYDMNGNVWEWVQDWYHDSYNGAPNDGSAWEEGGKQQTRAQHGGSWSSDSNYLRASSRDRGAPGDRFTNVGFRLARSLP